MEDVLFKATLYVGLIGGSRVCLSFLERGMCVRVENILWSGKFGDFDRGWFL